ncbi:hypothetical protein ABIB40_001705 [Pedobacter sp. UYP30]
MGKNEFNKISCKINPLLWQGLILTLPILKLINDTSLSNDKLTFNGRTK